MAEKCKNKLFFVDNVKYLIAVFRKFTIDNLLVDNGNELFMHNLVMSCNGLKS